MKTSELKPKPENASTLLVTMIFVVSMAFLLSSYLSMVQGSDQLVSRSQSWNSALSIAESGAEEGLAMLNQSGSSPGFSWSQNITRNLNGGKYSVSYYNSGGTVWIYSTGMVSVAKSGDMVKRVVAIRSQKSGFFMMGLVAINNIQFNGNGIAADSWNSYDPNQSTNGLYNGYVGIYGDVASVFGAVNIGNHIINGNLYLGPTATYDSSAGQVTGTIYYNANLSFPDASLPTTDSAGNTISWLPVPTTLTGSGKTAVTSHDITSDGYYFINDAYPVSVEPGVTATIDVKRDSWGPTTLDIGGGTTNSGNVVLYLESGSITLSGNKSGGASGNRAGNLIVMGLPAVTGITLSGTSSFVGAIYSPEASLTLNGGGNANNLIGSAVVNTVTLNGHYDFHYDTALATNGWNRGFVINRWQEL